ncbi:MAG: hypothetical protein ACO2PN_24040 [Pyrobaculum sp.]|jgi:hypothetical protein
MTSVGVIRKRGNRTVVANRDGEFEATIPFSEIREFITGDFLRWKVGRTIYENGDEYLFTSYEDFNRAAVYVLLRKGRLNRESAAKVALHLKSNEVEAIVGGLFLRLYIYRNADDEYAYRRVVDIFVNIAKAYAELATL